MKRYDPESLGDVLREAIQDAGMAERLLETQAAAAWPTVVGRHIAALTGKPYVKKGVMQIRVATAPLRQELNMSRSALRRLINDAVGKDVISDLRFV